MKKKITSIVKKSAKVGAAVCVAAGAVALMTSGAALKALTEGAKYLKNTVKKIIDDESKSETSATEEVVESSASNPAVEAEAVIAE